MAQNYAVTGNEAGGNAIQVNGQVLGDIHMPGSGNIDHCLRDLSTVDPREDKVRLEDSKDQILEDCYAWILDDHEYIRWKQNGRSGVLWINGGPGTGKTMMMLGLSAELSAEFQQKTSNRRWFNKRKRLKRAAVSYFFCQNAYPDRNNASSILKGLIYLLAIQSEEIMQEVRNKYQEKGKKTFEDIYCLRVLLQTICSSNALEEIFFVVDALDECSTGLLELLGIIGDKTLEKRTKVKWLLTSRNREDIATRIKIRNPTIIMLESERIDSAVFAFIRYKVDQISKTYQYDDELKIIVEEKLKEKVEGTFLWVALACKVLEDVLPYRILYELERLPPGLTPFYDQMLETLNAQPGNGCHESNLCLEILRSVIVAHRPLHLTELVSVMDISLSPLELSDGRGKYLGPPEIIRYPKEAQIVQSLKRLVLRCGSFLEEKGGTVSFFHQSAKDYFVSGAGRGIFASDGIAEKHRRIVYRSLALMSNNFTEDMASLKSPGANRNSKQGNNDLLRLEYACLYWVFHLENSHDQAKIKLLSDDGKVYKFLTKHLLHWIEALILLENSEELLLLIEKLQVISKAEDCSNHQLVKFLDDACRFVHTNLLILDQYPLQVYSSAVIFAPRSSLIGQHFPAPRWIKKNLIRGSHVQLSRPIKTLESHGSQLKDVEFSPDGKLLAAAAEDKIVLWDAKSGVHLQNLPHHSHYSRMRFKFSPDGKKLVSTANLSVRIWDIRHLNKRPEAVLIQNFDLKTDPDFDNDYGELKHADIPLISLGDDTNSNNSSEHLLFTSSLDYPRRLAILPDGNILMILSNSGLVILADSTTGKVLHALRLCAHLSYLGEPQIAFSLDGKTLVDGYGSAIYIRDTLKGTVLRKLDYHGRPVQAVAYSLDGKLIASALGISNEVKIWDAGTGVEVQTFTKLRNPGNLVFSPDSRTLACNFYGGGIWILDVAAGTILMKIPSHGGPWVLLMSFSPNGDCLASTSAGSEVKLWNTTNVPRSGPKLQIYGHKEDITYLCWAPSHLQIASGALDYQVKIWDVATGTVLRTFERWNGETFGRLGYREISGMAFSPDGTKFAVSGDSVTIWETSHWRILYALKRVGRRIKIHFSPDSQILMCFNTFRGNHPKFLDANTGTELNLPIPLRHGCDGAFSPDGKHIAYCTPDNLGIREFPTGKIICEIPLDRTKIDAIAFCADSKQLAASFQYKPYKILFWDVPTGKTMHTLEVVRRIPNFAFSKDGSYLETDMGRISGLRRDEPSTTACNQRNIFVGERWITYGGKEILWLPAEYRTDCVAVHGSTVVLGHKTGLMTFLEFDFAALDAFLDTEVSGG